MDLMSDLGKDKWQNKGVPPTGYKSLTNVGYASYNIFRRADTAGPNNSLTYYLSTDAGIPCQATLYGAERDPLRSIGHCQLRLKLIKETQVVTGIIIEDDYVEINDDFLVTVQVPEPEKKETANVDLSFASDLDPASWEKKGPAPKIKSDLGYVFYSIVRETPEKEDGALKYYLSTNEGVLLQAYLFGSKRNPLKDIGNCYLKMKKVNGKNIIEGIIIDDDWVESK